MKKLKNIGVGFVVSGLGSLPLGYLNAVGFQILMNSDYFTLMSFLLGVIFIEGFVIYFTLRFARFIHSKQVVKKWISIYSFVFLLILTYLSYTSSVSVSSISITDIYSSNAFVTGLILSLLNLAQIPFWTSWNLYLLHKSYIITTSKLITFYVFGTLLGTFAGMLTIIYVLSTFAENGYFDKEIILNYVWILFLGLAIIQLISIIKNNMKK